MEWQRKSKNEGKGILGIGKNAGANARKYIQQAIKSTNPIYSITAIGPPLNQYQRYGLVNASVHDSDPPVRREYTLALRHNESPDSALFGQHWPCSMMGKTDRVSGSAGL